jgi:hypothetical protein
VTVPSVCRLTLAAPTPARRIREHVTTGIALPRGQCRDAADLRLRRTTDGRVLALQARVLERWSDGSVRWALLDFQEDIEGSAPLELVVGTGQAEAPSGPVTVRTEGTRVTLTNDRVTLVVGPGPQFPFVEAACDGRRALAPDRSRLVVRQGASGESPLTVSSVEIEERGPLRAAVRLHGSTDGAAPLGITLRVEVFAGVAAARLRLVLHNPRPARHPGGYWELGDAGSVLLGHVGFEFALADDAGPIEVQCSLEPGGPFERFHPPFRLHQESSGQPNWQSRVHVNRHGRVPLRYRGYRLTAAVSEREGAHATPAAVVDRGTSRLTATSRLFWQVFPKAVEVTPDGALRIDLLPGGCDDLHEVQGGERMAHEFALVFGSEGPSAAEWLRAPAVVSVDPEWWALSGAVPDLVPVTEPEAPYERLVRAAVDGDDTFVHKRNAIDEYGWRHFGDFYADHENGPSPAGPLIVSHYNNQYDGLWGCLVQFMRSGDPRWWELACDLAAHVAHVDIYWTRGDKSAYNGGLFWHTQHYVDAGRSTHRCYPRAEGVNGGGPSIEQNYSSGLLLFHLMTGDPWSREAVLTLAQWSRDMDDGRRTVFRVLSQAPTGYASATGATDYHGPGRGPANAIQTFLNAYRLEGNREWMRQAEVLIHRCIHPLDEVSSRNLLDAERRWYYTVFLQALGRYLGLKSERGEEDGDWHYARASLLRYARWMATHEYPYLDKPEILEYPTETWAAQDMRKCEVFNLAAKYTAEAAERSTFIERARFFFRSSVDTLHRWPSHVWTRPTVLMLSYGYAHLWHEAHRGDLPLLPPSPALDFGVPAVFEPQRAIAMRRARRLAAAAMLAASIGALGLLL